MKNDNSKCSEAEAETHKLAEYTGETERSCNLKCANDITQTCVNFDLTEAGKCRLFKAVCSAAAEEKTKLYTAGQMVFPIKTLGKCTHNAAFSDIQSTRDLCSSKQDKASCCGECKNEGKLVVSEKYCD